MRPPSTNLKFPTKIMILLLVSLKSLVNAEYQPGWKPPRISNFRNYKIRNHHVLLKEGADNRFKLLCDVEDGTYPKPEIKWFKNKKQILEYSIQGIIVSNKKLDFIEPSIERHEGYYQCTAENAIGLAKSEIILVSAVAPQIPAEFMTPPVFNEKPKAALPLLGQDKVEFPCDADGVPRPSVKWTFNGVFKSKEEKLVIKNIGLDKVGTYGCNASNPAGYVYQEVYLNILTTSPKFRETPNRKQTVSIGMAVFLRCSAHGYPKPTIKWFFKGKEIINGSKNFNISKHGDLTITTVQAENEGKYKCQAENENGLQVIFADLKVVEGTKIISGPVPMSAQFQSTIRMNCTVVWDNNEELKVVWKKNSKELKPDGERITSDVVDNSLTIRNINFADAGVYTCLANAGGDTATDSGTLKVKGIPARLVVGEGPNELTTAKESKIEISCKVTGLPLPEHIWYYKKWDKVSGDYGTSKRLKFDKNPRIKMDKESGSLIIKNAKINDSGKYICQASNRFGEPVGKFAIVQVLESARLSMGPKEAWIWILIIIMIYVLNLFSLITCIACVRKRARQKGHYGQISSC